MRIFFIGDVVGRSGRAIVLDRLPKLITDWKLDLVVVNGHIYPQVDSAPELH